MVSPIMELIKVEKLSQYGFFDQNGQGYSWGRFLKDEDKNKVVPGASYEMVIYIGPKGGKSINKVGRQVEQGDAPPVVASAPTVEQPKVARQAPVVGRDFDKEARGKTFCQYMAAVLSNPSVNFETVEELFQMIDKCVARTFGDDKAVEGNK